MKLPYLSALDTDALRAAGIPEPWSFGIQDRVRFGEIDVLGHVNNAVYLRWFETFRINYFRERIRPLVKDRQGIVLRTVSVDFQAEIKPDESYVITGRTVEMGTTSFVQHYAVWVDAEIRTRGEAVIVTTGPDRKKAPIADDLRQAFVTLDAAAQR